MNESLIEQIKSILAKGQDMTIATVREDGFPQATTVSYVSDGLTVYFGCDPNSQKARNIARCNKVSLTVDLAYDDWNEIQGVSMAALAERITDPQEIEIIGKLMLDKFPQVAAVIPEETGEVALYRVSPKVVSVLDYSKGFGHTDLVEL